MNKIIYEMRIREIDNKIAVDFTETSIFKETSKYIYVYKNICGVNFEEKIKKSTMKSFLEIYYVYTKQEGFNKVKEILQKRIDDNKSKIEEMISKNKMFANAIQGIDTQILKESENK